MTGSASGVGLILLLAVTACLAQAQEPASSAAGGTKPADSASAAAPNTPKADSTEKKKSKKVWTNDEIGSVGGTVSVVGEASVASSGTGTKTTGDPAKGSAAAASDARQKQIESYRSQIQQLQGQIEAADKRIAQLKNFKAENTTPAGGINPNQGYNMTPVEDQVKQLEEKKKQLQAKIEDVENEARKNGIDPGDLR